MLSCDKPLSFFLTFAVCVALAAAQCPQTPPPSPPGYTFVPSKLGLGPVCMSATAFGAISIEAPNVQVSSLRLVHACGGLTCQGTTAASRWGCAPHSGVSPGFQSVFVTKDNLPSFVNASSAVVIPARTTTAGSASNCYDLSFPANLTSLGIDYGYWRNETTIEASPHMELVPRNPEYFQGATSYRLYHGSNLYHKIGATGEVCYWVYANLTSTAAAAGTTTATCGRDNNTCGDRGVCVGLPTRPDASWCSCPPKFGGKDCSSYAMCVSEPMYTNAACPAALFAAWPAMTFHGELLRYDSSRGDYDRSDSDTYHVSFDAASKTVTAAFPPFTSPTVTNMTCAPPGPNDSAIRIKFKTAANEWVLAELQNKTVGSDVSFRLFVATTFSHCAVNSSAPANDNQRVLAFKQACTQRLTGACPTAVQNSTWFGPALQSRGGRIQSVSLSFKTDTVAINYDGEPFTARLSCNSSDASKAFQLDAFLPAPSGISQVTSMVVRQTCRLNTTTNELSCGLNEPGGCLRAASATQMDKTTDQIWRLKKLTGGVCSTMQNPCRNGGVCQADGNFGFRCACAVGWQGTLCDHSDVMCQDRLEPPRADNTDMYRACPSFLNKTDFIGWRMFLSSTGGEPTVDQSTGYHYKGADAFHNYTAGALSLYTDVQAHTFFLGCRFRPNTWNPSDKALEWDLDFIWFSGPRAGTTSKAYLRTDDGRNASFILVVNPDTQSCVRPHFEQSGLVPYNSEAYYFRRNCPSVFPTVTPTPCSSAMHGLWQGTSTQFSEGRLERNNVSLSANADQSVSVIFIDKNEVHEGHALCDSAAHMEVKTSDGSIHKASYSFSNAGNTLHLSWASDCSFPNASIDTLPLSNNQTREFWTLTRRSCTSMGNPCKNNGTCFQASLTAPLTCTCQGDWKGSLCQEPIVRCKEPMITTSSCPTALAMSTFTGYELNANDISSTPGRSDDAFDRAVQFGALQTDGTLHGEMASRHGNHLGFVARCEQDFEGNTKMDIYWTGKTDGSAQVPGFFNQSLSRSLWIPNVAISAAVSEGVSPYALVMSPPTVCSRSTVFNGSTSVPSASVMLLVRVCRDFQNTTHTIPQLHGLHTGVQSGGMGVFELTFGVDNTFYYRQLAPRAGDAGTYSGHVYFNTSTVATTGTTSVAMDIVYEEPMYMRGRSLKLLMVFGMPGLAPGVVRLVSGSIWKCTRPTLAEASGFAPSSRDINWMEFSTGGPFDGSCWDGQLNNLEAGVDCGGAHCPACPESHRVVRDDFTGGNNTRLCDHAQRQWFSDCSERGPVISNNQACVAHGSQFAIFSGAVSSDTVTISTNHTLHAPVAAQFFHIGITTPTPFDAFGKQQPQNNSCNPSLNTDPDLWASGCLMMNDSCILAVFNPRLGVGSLPLNRADPMKGTYVRKGLGNQNDSSAMCIEFNYNNDFVTREVNCYEGMTGDRCPDWSQYEISYAGRLHDMGENQCNNDWHRAEINFHNTTVTPRTAAAVTALQTVCKRCSNVTFSLNTPTTWNPMRCQCFPTFVAATNSNPAVFYDIFIGPQLFGNFRHDEQSNNVSFARLSPVRDNAYHNTTLESSFIRDTLGCPMPTSNVAVAGTVDHNNARNPYENITFHKLKAGVAYSLVTKYTGDSISVHLSSEYDPVKASVTYRLRGLVVKPTFTGWIGGVDHQQQPSASSLPPPPTMCVDAFQVDGQDSNTNCQAVTSRCPAVLYGKTYQGAQIFTNFSGQYGDGPGFPVTLAFADSEPYSTQLTGTLTNKGQSNTASYAFSAQCASDASGIYMDMRVSALVTHRVMMTHLNAEQSMLVMFNPTSSCQRPVLSFDQVSRRPYITPSYSQLFSVRRTCTDYFASTACPAGWAGVYNGMATKVDKNEQGVSEIQHTRFNLTVTNTSNVLSFVYEQFDRRNPGKVETFPGVVHCQPLLPTNPAAPVHAHFVVKNADGSLMFVVRALWGSKSAVYSPPLAPQQLKVAINEPGMCGGPVNLQGVGVGVNRTETWVMVDSSVTTRIATCNDGERNGDETGIDCGGPFCSPCPTLVTDYVDRFALPSLNAVWQNIYVPPAPGTNGPNFDMPELRPPTGGVCFNSSNPLVLAAAHDTPIVEMTERWVPTTNISATNFIIASEKDWARVISDAGQTGGPDMWMVGCSVMHRPKNPSAHSALCTPMIMHAKESNMFGQGDNSTTSGTTQQAGGVSCDEKKYPCCRDGINPGIFPDGAVSCPVRIAIGSSVDTLVKFVRGSHVELTIRNASHVFVHMTRQIAIQTKFYGLFVNSDGNGDDNNNNNNNGDGSDPNSANYMQPMLGSAFWDQNSSSIKVQGCNLAGTKLVASFFACALDPVPDTSDRFTCAPLMPAGVAACGVSAQAINDMGFGTNFTQIGCTVPAVPPAPIQCPSPETSTPSNTSNPDGPNEQGPPRNYGRQCVTYFKLQTYETNFGQDVDPCTFAPCKNGGQCTRAVGGMGFTCDCSATGGYFGATCTIAPCTTGSYSANNTDCKPCPIGTFQNSAGKTACTSCPRGTYQNAVGKSACTVCSRGEFSVAHSSACSKCATGSFSAATGSPYCTPCPAGTVAPLTGQSVCSQCAAGTSNAVDGQVFNNTHCIPCTAGSFAVAAGASCARCDAGKYAASAGASTCALCPIGKFSDWRGSSLCKTCQAGSVSTSQGASSCVRCPAGTFSASATLCTACSSGFTSPAGSTSSGACVETVAAPSSLPALSASVSGAVITATWQAPSSLGCASCSIATYILRLNDTTTGALTYAQTSALTYAFTNLMPERTYCIHYGAINNKGMHGSGPDAAVCATTQKKGPAITSFTASDPDNADSVWGAGDQVTINFNMAVQPKDISNTTAIDALFAFSTPIGTTYSGQWLSGNTQASITIQAGDFSNAAAAPTIGVTTVHVKASGDLKNAAGTTAPSVSKSGALLGNWGSVASAIITPASTTPSFAEDVSFTIEESNCVDVDQTAATAATASFTVTVIKPTDYLGLRASAGSTPANSVTVTGISALGVVTYVAKPNYNGPVIFKFVEGATEVLGIVRVTPVNDAPILTVSNAAQSTSGNTLLSFTGLSVGDVDITTGGSDIIGVSLFHEEGGKVRFPNAVSGVKFYPTQGKWAHFAIAIGPVAGINSALSAMQGDYADTRGSSDKLMIEVNDFGNGAVGDTRENHLFATGSIAVSILCTSAAPPAFVNATMSTDYSRITVHLDKTILRENAIASCNAIFDSTSSARLGTDPFCLWLPSESFITVYLGFNATINPSLGHTLTWKANAIKACSSASTAASGSISVGAPATSVKPSVKVVQAPRVVGSCGTVYIWLESFNTGTFGREVSFTTTLPSSLSSISSQFQLTSNPLVFSASLLSPGTSYTFSFKVTNFLGVSSDAATWTISALPAAIPELSSVGPTVLTVKKEQGTFVGVVAKITACFSSQMHFSWTSSSASGPFATALAAATNPWFDLRSAYLTAGTTITLTARACPTSTYSASACGSIPFTITVPHSPLIANINFGAGATVTSSRDFTVDASSSSDPDSSVATLGYSWVCKTIDGGSCVDTITGLAIVLPASASFIVAAERLGAGEYVFTVTVSGSNSRTATASTNIAVVTTSPPSVTVSVLTGDVTCPRCKVVILATVLDPLTGAELLADPVYAWFITKGTVSLSTTVNNTQVLILNNEYTSGFFKAGETVEGFVTATVAGRAAGKGLFSFKINAAPSGGALTVTPSSGTIDTTFAMSTSGWSDPDGAANLNYVFFFVDPVTNETVRLNSRGPTTSLSTELVAGAAGAANALKVGVLVYDDQSPPAITKSSLVTITVAPPTGGYDIANLESMWATNNDASEKAADTSKQLRAIRSGVINLAKALANGGSGSAFRDKMINSLSSMTGRTASDPLQFAESCRDLTQKEDDLSLNLIKKAVLIINSLRANIKKGVEGKSLLDTFFQTLANNMRGFKNVVQQLEKPASGRHGWATQSVHARNFRRFGIQAVGDETHLLNVHSIYATVYALVKSSSASQLSTAGDVYATSSSGLDVKVQRGTAGTALSQTVISSGKTSSVTWTTPAVTPALTTTDFSVVVDPLNSYTSFYTGANNGVTSPAVSVFAHDVTNTAAPVNSTVTTDSFTVTVPATCDPTKSCRMICFRLSDSTSPSLVWSSASVKTSVVYTETTATTRAVQCTASAHGTFAVFHQDAATDSPADESPADKALALIAGAGVGGAVALFLFIALVVWWRRRSTASNKKEKTGGEAVEMHPRTVHVHTEAKHAPASSTTEPYGGYGQAPQPAQPVYPQGTAAPLAPVEGQQQQQQQAATQVPPGMVFRPANTE